MKFGKILLFLLCACLASAQVSVVVAPVPQLQFFSQTGQPLAFGCVFTYASNTITPLGTYTDSTGVTLNSNPVILSGGGSANIWLQAGMGYTFRVVSAGGSNCSSGSTLYTVNGLGLTGSTVLTTTVPFSSTPNFNDAAQNQLFLMTLTGNATANPMTFVGVNSPGYVTFQLTQDGSGGHSFSWPSNVVGGCAIGLGINQVTTQDFVYNGTNATAIGPCVTGTGPAISSGAITASGAISSTSTVTGTQLISNVATGTAPLSVTSTTVVPNLNVSELLGDTWAVPGTIGSTTPNSGVFTTLTANTSVVINGSQALTGVQGSTGTKVAAATGAFVSGNLTKTDANGNVVDAGVAASANFIVGATSGQEIQGGSTGSCSSTFSVSFSPVFSGTPTSCQATGVGGSVNVSTCSASGMTGNCSGVTNVYWMALGPK